MVSFTLRPHWLQNRGPNEPERSTDGGRGEAEPWASHTNLLTPRNCYALSSWNAVEDGRKKMHPSSRDDSIQIATGGFQMLDKKGPTIREQYWRPPQHRNISSAMVKSIADTGEQMQFRICDDHHRAKGLTNCYRLSSLVCLVHSKTDGLNNMQALIGELDFNAATSKKSPFCGSGVFFRK